MQVRIRRAESKPRRELTQKIRDGEAEAATDMVKLNLRGEFGQWPYLDPVHGTKYIAPWLMSDKVKAVTAPILKRLVNNVAQGTTDMPYEPTVSKGWDTYVDPIRYARCRSFARHSRGTTRGGAVAPPFVHNVLARVLTLLGWCCQIRSGARCSQRRLPFRRALGRSGACAKLVRKG